MPTPHIEIKNLSKIFYSRLSDNLHKAGSALPHDGKDDKIALNNINLSLCSGETIGIIGRNGAGKSTLLSLIAGIASPTTGDMTIKGHVTAIMTLGIGLREDLTGRENIYLDGEIQGKSRESMDALMDNIIEFSELGHFIDKPVKTYSTGMKSRLAFSMLVEIEPEILIIDEALSAGDIFFAQKASRKIRDICAKGKIVILVSHSMGAIESMCNRCLWMEKGRIIMDDVPSVVTQAYLKKIREEDERTETHHARFEQSEINHDAAYQINHVIFRLADSDYPQTIFHTQDHFLTEITLERRGFGKGSLAMVIERIDGIIVYQETLDLNGIEPDKKLEFQLELSLNPLVLNKGYYQLKLQVNEGTLCSNHFTRLFEIKNNCMPSGGSPLLHYPAEISLVNKETSVCSDSIELIAQ